jgi:hypothetical protein
VRTAKRILLACTAVAAVATSARAADAPVPDTPPPYPTKAAPPTNTACTSFEATPTR